MRRIRKSRMKRHQIFEKWNEEEKVQVRVPS